jgi:hypothetical protein
MQFDRRPAHTAAAPALLILLSGAWLSLASSSGRKQNTKPPQAFVDTPATELKNPALVIVNSTTCAVTLKLKGTTKRKLLIGPRTTFRSLVAAGRYTYALATVGGAECRLGLARKGLIAFLKKHRYTLTLAPPDD